jgi:hypothetical protein
MDNIIEPNETFDFSTLSLAHPVGIQGGAYFTKIENNKKPLYIQTPKGQTRQGFVKNGKKYYCDLMFDKNSEMLINWFEKLEERCKKLIYDRRDTWFQNSLEESDIETAFNSSIRIYKSGKFYLIRTNVKNNHTTNTPSINIYTEQEIPLTMDDVNTETNIISILEIQGIKFTSRNFQIEIELKQMMVLNNEPIFNNCLIKTNKHIENKESKHLEKFDIDLIPSKPDVFNEPIDDLVEHSETNEIIKESEINDIIKESGINEIIKETEINDITKETEINDITKEFETSDENIILDMEDLCEDIEENVDTLKEIGDVSLSLENNLETIKLKKPNQVYFELYREARNKAKMAKKNAILAYLEAKNIKKTYLIENLNDSDSDFDAEIDEVSESELEDFD